MKPKIDSFVMVMILLKFPALLEPRLASIVSESKNRAARGEASNPKTFMLLTHFGSSKPM